MGVIQLSDEDIAFAESLLLGNNKFDSDEKIPIIKCMDQSIDVVACPGSGKTTALLGKIMALMNHMPLHEGKGVCIITHTNVAINEIKKKLGAKSEILFQYPNFIGTIQSFTDRFLSGPFIKMQYCKTIASINDDFYYQKMFTYKDYINTLRNYAYGKVKSNIKDGMTWSEQIKLKDEYIKTLNVKRVNGEFDFFSNDTSLKLKDKTKDSYKALHGLLINELLEQGILRYSDSYLLAQMYVEKYPSIWRFFAQRFQYVFMDEVQDSSWIQEDILTKIFPRDKVIVQRFGDLNQAIYEENDMKGDSSVDTTVLQYEISHSMRFPQSIADFISNLRVEEYQKPLIGNGKTNTLVPHILIYEQDKIEDVKDKYVDILKQYHLDRDDSVFKCCGWVGYKEKEEQLSVKSYYQKYQSNKDKINRNVGLSFQSLLGESIKTEITVRNIYRAAIECISRTLNLKGIELAGKRSNFSRLEKYAQENLQDQLKQLRITVAQYAKSVVECNSTAFEIIGQCSFEILRTIDSNYKKEEFMKLFQVSDQGGANNNTLMNAYLKDGVTVLFDTVHGVKGETHTATLYVETYYNKKTDLERTLRFIVDNDAVIKNSDERKALKVAYVGMSRATDLLCIALSQKTYKKYAKELKVMNEEGKIEIITV